MLRRLKWRYFASSFGNQLDAKILSVLELQLVDHWLMQKFCSRTGTTGLGALFLEVPLFGRICPGRGLQTATQFGKEVKSLMLRSIFMMDSFLVRRLPAEQECTVLKLNSKMLNACLSSAVGRKFVQYAPSTLSASSYGSTVEQPIYSGEKHPASYQALIGERFFDVFSGQYCSHAEECGLGFAVYKRRVRFSVLKYPAVAFVLRNNVAQIHFRNGTIFKTLDARLTVSWKDVYFKHTAMQLGRDPKGAHCPLTSWRCPKLPRRKSTCIPCRSVRKTEPLSRVVFKSIPTTDTQSAQPTTVATCPGPLSLSLPPYTLRSGCNNQYGALSPQLMGDNPSSFLPASTMLQESPDVLPPGPQPPCLHASRRYLLAEVTTQASRLPRFTTYSRPITPSCWCVRVRALEFAVQATVSHLCSQVLCDRSVSNKLRSSRDRNSNIRVVEVYLVLERPSMLAMSIASVRPVLRRHATTHERDVPLLRHVQALPSPCSSRVFTRRKTSLVLFHSAAATAAVVSLAERARAIYPEEASRTCRVLGYVRCSACRPLLRKAHNRSISSLPVLHFRDQHCLESVCLQRVRYLALLGAYDNKRYVTRILRNATVATIRPSRHVLRRDECVPGRLTASITLMSHAVIDGRTNPSPLILVRCPDDKRRRSQCYVGLYRGALFNIFDPVIGRQAVQLRPDHFITLWLYMLVPRLPCIPLTTLTVKELPWHILMNSLARWPCQGVETSLEPDWLLHVMGTDSDILRKDFETRYSAKHSRVLVNCCARITEVQCRSYVFQSGLVEDGHGTSSDGMMGREKREAPEKTRRLQASSGTIPTCENPGDPAGNRLGLPRVDINILRAHKQVKLQSCVPLQKFHIGQYVIRHTLGNSAPVNNHFTIVYPNPMQVSKKGRGFTSMRQPMETRRRLRLNFIVLSALESASFLHWLLHKYEATTFLTELHVIEAHNCVLFIYWRRVTQDVSDTLCSDDERILKTCGRVPPILEDAPGIPTNLERRRGSAVHHVASRFHPVRSRVSQPTCLPACASTSDSPTCTWSQPQPSNTAERNSRPPRAQHMIRDLKTSRSSMTCTLDSTVSCTNMLISTAHWLPAVTVEGKYWASILQEVSNTVSTDEFCCEQAKSICENDKTGLASHLREPGSIPRPGHSRIFSKWESCWTMPLVGGFSWGCPVPPPPPAAPMLTSLLPLRLSRPQCLRAAQMSLKAVHDKRSQPAAVGMDLALQLTSASDGSTCNHGAVPVESDDWECILLFVSHWPRVLQEVSNKAWINGKGDANVRVSQF
ncbi:hypothetical protein PR048_024441 [Dryococelus australis]|uniref:Uncharacterized protein n=1 Tax=Dryococelus australis TaxID=614101 RepID=A0ABQ9GNP0_9NEOP|nr:hypothetical protein PR048_024441 [Dryococelus australis]